MSLAYSLVLSDPFLRFSIKSPDDFVPLVAFNVGAIAAAYVAGRLREEASSSQKSSRQLQALLGLSEALQGSVSLEQVLDIAETRSFGFKALAIRLDDGRMFHSGPSGADDRLLSLLARSNGDALSLEGKEAIQTERFDGGEVIGITSGQVPSAKAELSLLAIAAERSVLNERVTEADLIRRSEGFKTTLLSSVSHDLRTPLAVISASASSLMGYRQSLPPEVQDDMLQTICQQADRLNHMTAKLLSLGRIEGGLDSAAMPLVDAVEVLGAAIAGARSVAGGRRITKQFDNASALVRADGSLLQQAFFNVLENAAFHTPADTAIEVVVASDPYHLFVSVEDYGHGVPESERQTIFDRFKQGTSSANAHKGSGLGLSIARGFIRAVHGEIEVRDRPDGQSGACFMITLPIAQGVSA